MRITSFEYEFLLISLENNKRTFSEQYDLRVF